MKKAVIAVAILLCHAASAIGQQCVISARKENIVYIGIPNPIDIAIEGRFCKDFTVSSDNGSFEPGATTCSYNLSPVAAGRTEISVKEKKSGKIIGNAVFRAKEIPPPTVTLAGKSGGEISRAILKVQIALLVRLEGFDFNANYAIENYRVTIFRNEKVIFTETDTEARFPKTVTNAFANTQVGDVLLISDIKFKSYSKMGSIQPVEYRIIE